MFRVQTYLMVWQRVGLDDEVGSTFSIRLKWQAKARSHCKLSTIQITADELCMQDKKKIEADEPVFGLASVDLVEVEAPTWHIAEHLPAIRCTHKPY